MMALGIILTAKDAFSPVFSQFGSTLGKMTKSTKAFGASLAVIGTGLKGISMMGEDGAKTVIKSFVDLEEAQTQLKNTLMKSDGSVSPFFKSISDEATILGNKLPGTTADFLTMASSMKALGIEEKTIVGGGLKAAAYLGAVLKIPYEQAAEATAKFKQALSISDSELLPFIDDIQRMAHMGVKVEEMSYAFSKFGATVKGLGLGGLKIAREIEPLVGLMIQNGASGEIAGSALSGMTRKAVGFDGSKAQKDAKEAGVNFHFTDKKGKFLGLSNMVTEYMKLSKLSDNARISLMKAMAFSDEEQAAINTIVKAGSAGIADYSKKMKIQADINMRAAASGATLGSMWEAMTGTFTNFLALVGGSFSGEMKGITTIFSDMSSWMADTATKYPMFAKVIGALVIGIPVVAGVLGTLGIVVGGMATAMGFLGVTTMATFGWIIVGVALIAGAVALFSMDWAGAWEGLKIITTNVWDSISSYFSGTWDGIKSTASTVWTVVKNVFSWTPLGMIISNWGAISSTISNFMAPVTNIISSIWNGVKSITSAVWDGIKTSLSVAWDGIKILFSWTPIGMIINNWGAISSVFVTIVDTIKKPFVEFFDWIGDKFGYVIDKISSVAGFFADNNSSMLTVAPQHIPANNLNIARAQQATIGAGRNGSQNNVTHNNTNTFVINGANGDPKSHALEVKKHLDKLNRDKQDKSYSMIGA